MHKKTVHNLHLSNLHIVCNLQSILHVEIGEKVVQEKKSRDTLFVHENKNWISIIQIEMMLFEIHFSSIHLYQRTKFSVIILKVAFIQKVLMHVPFPQTDEPYYFPGLKPCHIRCCSSSEGSILLFEPSDYYVFDMIWAL